MEQKNIKPTAIENPAGSNFSEEMSYRGKAYQQLVTDKDGKGRWVDQLAYDGRTEISWDGDITGRPFFDAGNPVYKVSDLIPSKEEIIGGTFISIDSKEITITQNMIQEYGNCFVVHGEIYVIPIDNFELDGVVIPEKGIYMLRIDDGLYTNSLIYGKVKQLDGNFMPEGYPLRKQTPPLNFREETLQFEYDDVFNSYMSTAYFFDNKLKVGDKLTIIWDGVSYEVIVIAYEGEPSFGDLSLLGGEPASYPFAWKPHAWFTRDESESHTISVGIWNVVTISMDGDFIPQNYNIIFTSNNGKKSCNVTFSQLKGWIKRGLPIFARYEDWDQRDFSIITGYKLFGSSQINFGYFNSSGSYLNFSYLEDGTFGEVGPS